VVLVPVPVKLAQQNYHFLILSKFQTGSFKTTLPVGGSTARLGDCANVEYLQQNYPPVKL
jgi:hypothetical protein